MMFASQSLILLVAACSCSLVPCFDGRTQLLWSDDFGSGSVPDSSIWSYDVGSNGGWGNGELQEYKEENVEVKDGNLVIRIDEKVSLWAGRTLTSGRIRSNGKLEFQYGTVEAKIKPPDPSDGLSPAFWMLGSTFPRVGWPSSGQVDIMQLGSSRALSLDQATTRVGSAVHWEEGGRNRYGYNELETSFDIADDFNIYRLEWTPDSITTFVNEIEIMAMNISSDACSSCEELHQPFFLVVNIAAGGGYTRIYRQEAVTAPLPAEMLIDYIRVYDNGHTILSGSAMPSSPTVKSSAQPSMTPATAPSSTPTGAPSVKPALSPTVEPSAQPSMATTTSVSTIPTVSPSLTLIPTIEPSSTARNEEPTVSPSSLTESPFPSSSPTLQAPTPKPQFSNAPIERFKAQGITMTLTDVRQLSKSSELRWADITAVHLSAEIAEIIGPDLVDAVLVSVHLISQNPPYDGSERALLDTSKNGLRGLQVKQELVFDANVLIQSVVTDHDVNRYIMGAFNSEAEKTLYLAMLKVTGDVTFREASNVLVAPAVLVSRVESPVSGNGGEEGISTWMLVVVIVASVAAVAFAAIGTFVYFRHREKHNSRRTTITKGLPSSLPPIIETVIGIKARPKSPLKRRHTPEDNNSHGTSLNHNLTHGTFEDEDMSSLESPSVDTMEYSYDNAFRYGTDSVASNDSQQSDFRSGFDQSTYTSFLTNGGEKLTKFSVEVPPGKVGLVLETSEEGVPIVEQVKASSPLAGQVQVGDRLLSLDGRDVTMMIATTISRLIASKEDNRVRQFMFARPEEEFW